MHRLLPLALALNAACGAATAVGPVDVPAPLPPPRPAQAFESGERSEYRVSVLGIPAADGWLEARQGEEGTWELETYGEALPWLAMFYDLKLRMRSVVHETTLGPISLHREGVNGGSHLRREATWRKRGRVRIAARKRGWKRARRYNRRAPRDAHDPMGAVFAMRRAMLEAEDPSELVGARWHAFDGAWTRRLEVLSVSPKTELMETPISPRTRVRSVRVRIHRIQVKGDRRIPKKRDDRIWTLRVTADGRSIVVAAEGEGPFGPASAMLTAYRPATPPPGVAPSPRLAATLP